MPGRVDGGCREVRWRVERGCREGAGRVVCAQSADGGRVPFGLTFRSGPVDDRGRSRSAAARLPTSPMPSRAWAAALRTSRCLSSSALARSSANLGCS